MSTYDTVTVPNIQKHLDDLIKKAQWVKEQLSSDKAVYASDFDDLNNIVRDAFKTYSA